MVRIFFNTYGTNEGEKRRISNAISELFGPPHRPASIKVGTTRAEVFKALGEPPVYRMTAGVETAIYPSEDLWYRILYGEYEGVELIVRFNADGLVSDVRVEVTGSGYGVLTPPAQATIGRSIR